MGLKEVLGFQKNFNIDELCKRPIAKTQEEVDEWQKNNVSYLKVKAKNIKPLSNDLENDVDEMFKEHEEVYFSFVESWYKHGFKGFNKALLMSAQKNGDISKDKMREEYEKIENTNLESVSTAKKVDFFFFVFENIIDSINKKKNWFDIYKGSAIRGDGLVRNISSLDLFAWQLPNSDLRNKNNYEEVAKIMIIFFFIEKIYKREDSLSNNINPFDKIMFLDKILSYYYYLKEKTS